jgi:hypothetical protein
VSGGLVRGLDFFFLSVVLARSCLASCFGVRASFGASFFTMFSLFI